jgi:signal transduction histidine kinase
MKLLHKTLKIYLIFSLVIFIVSIPVIYYLVQDLWITDVDESLIYQKEKIIKGLTNNNLDTIAIENFTLVAGNFDVGIEVIPLSDNNFERDSIYNNNFYDETRQHIEPFRELTSIINEKGSWYKIIVRKDLVESRDLIRGIVFVQVTFFILLLLGIVLLNSYFSKKIWKPFYFILSKLETYKIDSEEPIEVKPSDVEEFNQLNQSVQLLTATNIQIYKAQKEFTENAAHETQTPLAVIKNQLDLLAQDEQINQNQSEIINKIDRNISLLSKLNRNLLLLAKIENKQFNTTESVVISEIINEVYGAFDEHILLKGIQFTSNIFEHKPIKSNPHLVHSLLFNLMTNAIKYNVKNGLVELALKDNTFSISNTGGNSPLPKDRIFERFYKQSNQTESVGLGLAIVKKICDSLNFEITYQFTEPNKHSFTVLF